MPIVGGHTNIRTDRSQLSVAIVGRAKRLLTSFDARPGDVLVAAVDHRGRYRAPFDNWEAATDAPPERLRGDLDILPQIAEAGLCPCRQGHQPGRHRWHGDHAGGMFRRRHRYRCDGDSPSRRRRRSTVGSRPSRASAICCRSRRRMSRRCLAVSPTVTSRPAPLAPSSAGQHCCDHRRRPAHGHSRSRRQHR